MRCRGAAGDGRKRPVVGVAGGLTGLAVWLGLGVRLPLRLAVNVGLDVGDGVVVAVQVPVAVVGTGRLDTPRSMWALRNHSGGASHGVSLPNFRMRDIQQTDIHMQGKFCTEPSKWATTGRGKRHCQ